MPAGFEGKEQKDKCLWLSYYQDKVKGRMILAINFYLFICENTTTVNVYKQKTERERSKKKHQVENRLSKKSGLLCKGGGSRI